ncbi:MAG: alpha/beta fold hydrolase [Gammaproteobacteria bacterium]
MVGQPALAAQADQQGRSCHLPGIEEALRCARVDVPLDYQNTGAGKLALHVTIAPAFRESARSDPLFVLAGGPGEAGSDVVPLLAHTFRRARATRDIVFIDQRGTGKSGRLACNTPDDVLDLSDAQYQSALRACIARLNRPLDKYTTANAARDIDQVRRVLGYASVNLWGGSYGTRLAQVYARMFPASTRSLVLDGVAAPDQVIPAGGRDGQAALELLFRQCAQDAACHKAYPNLEAEFDTVAQRVASGSVKVRMADPRTAEPRDVQLTQAHFLGTVHNVLYNALDGRRLPFLIHSAFEGRWAPFVARRNINTDVSTDANPAMVLYLAVICAEDMPRMTAQLRTEDAHGSFMGIDRIDKLAAMCKVAGVPPARYGPPSPIAAPTLLLSGALDPVTPPHRAQSAARMMARAQHLVAANAGHGVSQLGCTPRLLREFLDHPAQPVDAKCLSEIPAPSFQLGSAGPQP